MRSQTAIFSKLVGDFMVRSPLAVGRRATIGQVVAAMEKEKASSATVIDDRRRPLGIITENDITRRVVFRAGKDCPVEELMTAPVHTITEGEYLYHAIAIMRRYGLRHMPAVGAEGKLVGMLNLKDALAVAAERLIGQIDRLTREMTLDGLRKVHAAQVEVAEELIADNLPAVDVQALLTRINNDIYRRIVDAAVQAMNDEGWGEPPVSFAVIVFGSGGRGENYLFPDQDNGFVLADYPDDDHAGIDTFFIELAERMTRNLDSVGFPFCKGGCMATNPLWRKTLSQWISQITLWGRTRHEVAVRLADIFFDFRTVWGDRELTRKLREKVTKITKANPFFLQSMYHDKAEADVGLNVFGGLFGGLFGRFVLVNDDPEHKGCLAFKHAALLPLVSAVRLLALREGVMETSTCRRIAALADLGVFNAGESKALTRAFGLLTDVMFKAQIADFKAGRTPSYYIHPRSLAPATKDRLVEAMKDIDALRDRVRSDFTAEIF